MPGDPLELRSSRSFACFSSSWSCLRVHLAVGDALLAPRRARRRCARARSSFASDALLDLRQLGRAARATSLSISARSRTASSRASICASRRSASASRSRLGEQQLARAARGCRAREPASAWSATNAAAAPTTIPISDPDDDEHAPLLARFRGDPRVAASIRHAGPQAASLESRSEGRTRVPAFGLA